MNGLHQVLFRIQNTEEDGRHLVAIRDLAQGELIFTESPITFGPGDTEGVCIVCLKQIRDEVCSRCWWPVCGEECRTSRIHNEECRLLASCVGTGPETSLPFRHLLALRGLLVKDNPRLWSRVLELQDHRGVGHVPCQREEDLLEDQVFRDLLQFIRQDCGLVKVTISDLLRVHQVTSNYSLAVTSMGGEFPGLYLTGAMLTQSCIQNTRVVFKGKEHRLCVYAATSIRRGDQLTHSRLKNLLLTGTLDRRRQLREVHRLYCNCLRCKDPTEMNTNISGVLCQRCDDRICLPQDPIEAETQWECRGCGSLVSSDFINSLLLSIQELEWREGGLGYLRDRTRSILPDFHYLVLAEKSKHFLQFQAVSSDELVSKVATGREILKLTNILEPGLSAFRESILVNLGMSLQILLSNEVMARYTDTDSEEGEDNLLTDHQMFAAFRDAVFCYKQAREGARYLTLDRDY